VTSRQYHEESVAHPIPCGMHLESMTDGCTQPSAAEAETPIATAGSTAGIQKSICLQESPLSLLLRRRWQRSSLEAVLVGAVICILIVSGGVTHQSIRRMQRSAEVVAHTHQVLSVLDRLESLLKDAETRQRGFLITGEEKYLASFETVTANISGLVRELFTVTPGNALLQSRIKPFEELIEQKTSELGTTIQLRREAGLEAAAEAVKSNAGQIITDKIHEHIFEMRESEGQLLSDRELTSNQAYEAALWAAFISTLIGLFLVGAVFYTLQYGRRKAEKLEKANRRQDQHMRWFLEQVKDYAIFTMDAQCRATSWNQGVKEVLGFEEQEFIGHDIRKLIFTPEAHADGIPEKEFCLAALDQRASDDRWMMRKGGERFWASGITTSIRDENNHLIGYSKVMRNLTMRKQAEDELTELAARLSEMDRGKDEFLATLAHELRNPLAPIKNAVQLLGLLKLDPEVDELRQMMERQVEQLVRLIDDLLDVSRISRGKITLRKDVVELKAVVDAAVEASAAFIAESGQQLVITLNDHTPIFVHADPSRLTQVVSNLLNNSAKYSDAGCRIELSVGLENGQAVICVRDNGIGIAPHRLDDIFQMFAQVDDNLERGNAGLGIGLTLVKTLVELHDGTVIAESQGIGQGSAFTVRLPAVNAAEPKPSNATVETAAKPARSFRVLVVEDMRALRIIISRLLKKLGHQVEFVENGTQAMQKLAGYTPEVIVSDIAMPGMTGYDLARRIRLRPDLANVYLVALTGFGQTADRDRALEAGFDEHMVKPVELAALQSLFERLSSST